MVLRPVRRMENPSERVRLGYMSRILVAEDDVDLAKRLRAALVDAAHAVDLAHDGEQAWLMAGVEPYDVIVLDIMLPKLSGLEVLHEIRKAKIITPVLLLTARDRIEDKVKGLDLGADDYLTKPFALAELLARIRALCRREGPIRDTLLCCEDLTVDTSARRVHRGSRDIQLTAKEYSLLVYLMHHQESVVSRTDIVEKVWDINLDMFSDVVKVAISRLRKKLEAEGEAQLIHTVRGVGYIMEAARS